MGKLTDAGERKRAGKVASELFTAFQWEDQANPYVWNEIYMILRDLEAGDDVDTCARLQKVLSEKCGLGAAAPKGKLEALRERLKGLGNG